MILILSQDADAIKDIWRNQANTDHSVFGDTWEALSTTTPVAQNENLFIVAQQATRGQDWSPVVGDEKQQTYWTAQQAMVLLDHLVPANYAGNVYVASCDVADPRANVSFASSLKTQLAADRRNIGKVFGQNDAARGPIPPPDDSRWVEAQAA